MIVGPVSRLSLFRPVLGKRRPRREAAAALVRLGWESEGVGYPGLSLAAVRRTRSWYGQALERWRRTRRVLRMTTGADLQELEADSVRLTARAIVVPLSPSRRIVAISV